jgi:hypothetical protein
MLGISDPLHARHTHLGRGFLQAQISYHPIAMAEVQVIAPTVHLTNALQQIRPPQLQTLTLQVVGDLQDIFHKAAHL